MAPRKQYTKRRQFTIGLDEEELEGLREIANRQGLSMADVVRGMVCILIEKQKPKEEEDG